MQEGCIDIDVTFDRVIMPVVVVIMTVTFGLVALLVVHQAFVKLLILNLLLVFVLTVRVAVIMSVTMSMIVMVMTVVVVMLVLST